MRKAKAYIKCIKLRKDGTEQPLFSITYKGVVLKKFYADHIGEAGQIARYFLNRVLPLQSGKLYSVEMEWR